MVPGSFGCGSTVFAQMATLAPSRAARIAMARPIPREAPVMKSVFPCSVLALPNMLFSLLVKLISFEIGTALFDECGDAFPEISGTRALRKERDFIVKMLLKRCAV